MRFDNIAQAARCQNIFEENRRSETQLRTWVQHERRLGQRLAAEKRQLSSLETQSRQTGDVTGFADQIGRLRSDIAETERQIELAERNQSDFENQIERAYSMARRAGCPNIA